MYVYTYVLILIRPPIPYITSSRCKRLHKFRPVEILLHKGLTQGSPLVNPLQNMFLKCKTLVKHNFF